MLRRHLWMAPIHTDCPLLWMVWWWDDPGIIGPQTAGNWDGDGSVDTGGWGVRTLRTDSKVRTISGSLVSGTCCRYNECVDSNSGNVLFELMIRNICSERCGGCFANSLSSLNSDPALRTQLLANSGVPTIAEIETGYTHSYHISY